MELAIRRLEGEEGNERLYCRNGKDLEEWTNGRRVDIPLGYGTRKQTRHTGLYRLIIFGSLGIP